MRVHRDLIIQDSLHNRIVQFEDGSSWILIQKLSEKAWVGYLWGEDNGDMDPFEAHAVYECEQVKGSSPKSRAIIKARIEVPKDLDPDETPADRSRHAKGMRLNSYTTNEIEQLRRVTEEGFNMTPKLLAVRIEQQDETMMQSEDEDGSPFSWWMPGGYVVYILMTKLPAISLTMELFWNFDITERHEFRQSFRRGLEFVYIVHPPVFWLISRSQLQARGFFFEDARIENLMWNRETKLCYFIDFEDVGYDPDRVEPWIEALYYGWGLKRSLQYDETEW